MPMQSQAQAQPQPNPVQATQGALQQAKQAPTKPGQINVQGSSGGPAPQPGQDDQFSQEIVQNLEQHLNSIDPRQKQFLASSLQHYANIVIPVLGIVCGQEVFQYFLQIYQQHFANGAGQKPQQPPQPQQPNSAPNPQGQQPNPATASPQSQQAQGQAPAGQPQ